MPLSLTRRAGFVAPLVAAAVAASVLPAYAAPPRLPTPDRDTKINTTTAAAKDRLGRHDRSLLATAQRRGQTSVTIMMAVEKGEARAVAAGVRRAGGRVGFIDQDLGYVRASVPTGSVDRVSELRSVSAVDLQESVSAASRSSATTTSTTNTSAAAPNARTKDANPYLPTQDTGATLFKQAQPTWDGRGVTIGILDDGVDLDHPALTTTSTGERKIIDWVTATDPLGDADPTWLDMDETVAGPSFVAEGSTWTAPGSGSYRFARFAEAPLVGALGGDVNRDGDTSDVFGVLSDPATTDVWVDTNQDLTFSAAERIRPYREAFQIGRFGVDNPATPRRESVPFVVESRDGYVNIGIVAGENGTHVAGIAAGSKLFGGTMNGQAPGARSSPLVPVVSGAAVPTTRCSRG